MKIWNIPLGTNALYFLRKFTGHLHHLHMWLFTDLPEAVEKNFVLGTKLDYFLRLLKICDVNEGNQLTHQCQLFGRSSGEDSAKEKKALESQIQSIAAKLNVNQYLFEKSVDITGLDFLSKLNALSTVKPDHNLITVPLAMLFLRGMLENELSMFMKRSQLIKLANKIGLKDVDEFCKIFTSFGSIFDLGLIIPQHDTVIIKPELFLAKINEICDCKEGSRDYIKQGIIKHSDTQTWFKLKNEGSTFMSVLCDVEMAAFVPEGRYMQEDNTTNTEHYYYMPSLNNVTTQNLSTCIHILLKIENLLKFVNLEILTAKYAMKQNKSIHILPSENENVTLLKDIEQDIVIKLKYMGNHVEIDMIYPYDKSIKILTPHVLWFLKVYHQIASYQKGQFVYAVAVVCATDGEYHVLPHELCDVCKGNKYFDLWRQVLLSNLEVRID